MPRRRRRLRRRRRRLRKRAVERRHTFQARGIPARATGPQPVISGFKLGAKSLFLTGDHLGAVGFSIGIGKPRRVEITMYYPAIPNQRPQGSLQTEAWPILNQGSNFIEIPWEGLMRVPGQRITAVKGAILSAAISPNKRSLR